MEKTMFDNISNVKWGEIKEFKNLAVISLFGPASGTGPAYITMEDAINTGKLSIKEVSSGGHVPELLTVNDADSMVLLLDGEEVIGAKQNRILNASILLEAHSKTVIPVSCVEAHRWSYSSDKFTHSDSYLNYDIRREKHRDVHESLAMRHEYRSDQGKVWNKIEEMHKDLGVKSNTGAMHDAYVSVDEKMKEYLDNFKPESGVNGLFVFIGGKVAGFDMISRDSAFAKVFPKLIKSYAMDAVRADMAEERKVQQSQNKAADKKPAASIEQAKYFMDEIKSCNENRFKSAGLGDDFRYEGQYAVGSALIYEDSVIHTAFFRIEKEDSTGNMSSYRERMQNRRVY